MVASKLMWWLRVGFHWGFPQLSIVFFLVAIGCSSGEQSMSDNTTGVMVDSGLPASSDPSVSAGGDSVGQTGGAGTVASTGASSGAMAGTMMTTADAGTGGDAGTNGDRTTAADLFTVNYQLASDVDPQAPGTVGIVEWSVALNSVTDASIEFGLDGAFDMSAPVDLNEANFRTLLLGMKPSHSYTFRIIASDGSGSYVSDTYTIETGPPTDKVAVGAMNIMDEAAHMPGFIVGSYHSNSAVIWIMDADGEIVWWFDAGVGAVARARMSADSKNMWIVIADQDGGYMQRVSMDTFDPQTYSFISTHDVTPVEGELVAYIDKDAIGVLSGGCGVLKEVTPTGEPKTIFEPGALVPAAEFCHSNALRYSKTEDVYTMSDYGHDVYVVSRTGELLWSLAAIVPGGQATWGGAPQHGHHLVDDGLVIFANNGGPNATSAVIKYNLQGEEVFRYESAAGLDTLILGDVQVLPGGNMLISYCTAGTVQEIDASGNLVMEFQSSPAANQIGYVLWRDSLYGFPSDVLQ